MAATETVDFDMVAPRVDQALRKLLGENATIDLSPGFEGRVRVKVVSPRFNGLKEAEKSSVIWNELNNTLKDEVTKISYVIAYSTDEL